MLCFTKVFALFTLLFLLVETGNSSKKAKKEIRDYTEADLEKLYEEWEANDGEELPEDEKPDHLRPKPKIDFEHLKQMSNDPDDMMKLSKKGQSVMMFVSVVDPDSVSTSKQFTSKMSTLWQSSLNNNHVDVQVYAIESDRLLFMFRDGSQAWDSRKFLLEQKECKEIVLEAKRSHVSQADVFLRKMSSISQRAMAIFANDLLEHQMSSLTDEKKVEAAALSQVAAMFQRPSQLEKLDVLRKRADRKKAAVEAMLRTGVQSQLEGIRAAIGHLQAAGDDVKQIENSMQSIFTQLQSIPQVKVKMSKLSQANTTHSQYAAAMENLKHIFNVSDTIEKSHEFIMEGKLLQAHKNIMELENARDDLMFEVHKLHSDRREYDKNLLKNYFADVEKLVQDLAKQIWYICSRALEAVCGNETAAPQQLVSALRIIEREERIDQYYIDQKTSSNQFMPPGRPRQWRKQLFEVLLKNVRHRVEGNQFEDRTTNRQWLARYLEVCRRTVVEDLKVVKSGLVACFPPEYNIYDRFIKIYHDTIALRVKEISSEPLEKNELVQLLSWIQAYPGENMLGTPKLGIQANALVQEQPLLVKSATNQLHDRFVELTRKDMREWLDKALIQEKDDWYKHVLPEVDSNGCFYTQLPSILFGMIEDTVSLSKEIAQDIVPRVIDVGVDEFHNFAAKYKDASMAYKGKHFEDRAYFQQYTATMIAIANNLDICCNSTDKLEKHIRLTMEAASTGMDISASNNDSSLSSARSSSFASVNRQELIQKIDQLKKKWNFGMQFAITALLDEIFEDIRGHLEQIMTRTWLMGSADLETICVTTADYHNDYKRLRPHIEYMLIKELLYKVVGEYVIGIDSRRLTFANYDERHLAAERLRADSNRIEQLFKTFFEHNDFSMPMITPVLSAMAEIIDLRDKSLLSLEASGFVRKYPDVHLELLSSILQIREDVGRVEAKTISEEALNNARFHPKGDQEILKLFQLCRGGGKKGAMPALESGLQNMFASLVNTSLTTAKGVVK